MSWLVFFPVPTSKVCTCRLHKRAGRRIQSDGDILARLVAGLRMASTITSQASSLLSSSARNRPRRPRWLRIPSWQECLSGRETSQLRNEGPPRRWRTYGKILNSWKVDAVVRRVFSVEVVHHRDGRRNARSPHVGIKGQSRGMEAALARPWRRSGCVGAQLRLFGVPSRGS